MLSDFGTDWQADRCRFCFKARAWEAKASGQVPGFGGKAGIVDVGVIAVDGTQPAAATSGGAFRTYEQIAAEIIAEAGRIDAAEDEATAMPAAMSCPRGFGRPTAARLASQSQEELERVRAENPEPLARNRLGTPVLGQPPPAGLEALERRANQRYEAYRARGVMRNGRRFGARPEALLAARIRRAISAPTEA